MHVQYPYKICVWFGYSLYFYGGICIFFLNLSDLLTYIPQDRFPGTMQSYE